MPSASACASGNLRCSISREPAGEVLDRLSREAVLPRERQSAPCLLDAAGLQQRLENTQPVIDRVGLRLERRQQMGECLGGSPALDAQHAGAVIGRGMPGVD
jgi:hypothetical protein